MFPKYALQTPMLHKPFRKCMTIDQWGFRGLKSTRVDTKINGHEDKRSSEFFKYKWCKQHKCTK